MVVLTDRYDPDCFRKIDRRRFYSYLEGQDRFNSSEKIRIDRLIS